jgi:hypothetical protein
LICAPSIPFHYPHRFVSIYPDSIVRHELIHAFDVEGSKLDELGNYIPNETKVYPLGNSAQGIYTIGDCRKALEERKINIDEL